MKERITEMQELPCVMTPDELSAESQRLVQDEQELAKQEAEKKASVAGFNASLKLTKQSIQERVKTLSTGKEMRQVEVEKRFRYQDDAVDWVRLDTNEVVQTLPMDAFDRQESLELDGANDEPLPPPSKPQKRNRKKRGVLTEVPDTMA